MATKKRRVVYLSDSTWSRAREDAEFHHRSISGLIEELIDVGWIDDEPDVPTAKVRETSFAEFRPAPKPGRR